MSTIFYTAATLDGFLADEQDSLEWLFPHDIDMEAASAYPFFVKNVGALAMGSATYEWVREHDEGPWPYEQTTWVFTSRQLAAPDGDIRFAIDVAATHAEMVAAADGKDVWLVGGGDLVGQFADLGLVDEIHVQYTPVTLGSGKPLLPRRLQLELLGVERNRDFVCTRYAVKGPLGG
ncbi:MAG: dihydrofolate reductase [Myxococcales bacterium]|nr:MAG: dihydrofolate reductase [Myxococcales bacterium]